MKNTPDYSKTVNFHFRLLHILHLLTTVLFVAALIHLYYTLHDVQSIKSRPCISNFESPPNLRRSRRDNQGAYSNPLRNVDVKLLPQHQDPSIEWRPSAPHAKPRGPSAPPRDGRMLKESPPIWLSSPSSNVDHTTVVSECIQMHEFCTEGPLNERGEKGEPGAVGVPGDRGVEGEEGRTGLMGPPGPTGPVGPSGKDGTDMHCIKCPYPQFELNRGGPKPVDGATLIDISQCPKIEPTADASTQCSTDRSAEDGFHLDAQGNVMPRLVKSLMDGYENRTEVEEKLGNCFRVCVTNHTGVTFAPEITTTTEVAYIEGEVAHCFLEQVGKPIFHAHLKTYYGSWMRDTHPRTGDDVYKRWVTQHFYGNVLYEYANEAEIRRDNPSRTHYLPHVYDGTNHVFFNGSLFYHRGGTPAIGKYDTGTGEYSEVIIDPSAAFDKDQYLYNQSYSYFDLAIDENALWVMYHQVGRNELLVHKLDIQNLTIYTKNPFNLTLINHEQVSNGFVICGNLYMIKSSHLMETEVAISYDFYRFKYRMPDIPWVNLYKNANSIQYCLYDRRIYIYDHGYLLTVPARLEWRAK